MTEADTAEHTPADSTVTEWAPAKINLALHLTGRRSDGYHLLDSLVMFAGPTAADVISVARGTSSVRIIGPQADGLASEVDNLVARATRLFPVPVDVTLEKMLPVASGVGGGSADAAATLRAVARATGCPMPTASQVLSLGADVPVCMVGRASRMRGIGEDVTPAPGLPALPVVLANPGVGVSTPEVFRELRRRENAPMSDLPKAASLETLCDWLAFQRNDLEPAARALVPSIDTGLTALRFCGARLARMSGSGATCFGVFLSLDAAQRASERIIKRHPDWWCVATELR